MGSNSPSTARQPLAGPAGHASFPLDAFDLAPGEVASRFRWAERQGNSQWLWPDLRAEDWADALVRIEAVARDVITLGSSERRLDGNATAIGVAGFTSGMGPLLGHWLETGKVAGDEPVKQLLEFHLRHNRLRMDLMSARAASVSAAFGRERIAHTLLKGMHTAHRYFPEPGARPLSDIDLVLAPADEDRAGQVLEAAGFSPGPAYAWPPVRTWRQAGSPDSPRSLCLTHADNPWSVDLHTSLDRRYSAGSPVLRLDAVEAPPDPSPVSPDAQVLGQPLLLLHLAVHACCRLESLTMLRLVEMVLVIRADLASGSLSWDAFGEAAERTGALGCIYPALRLCEQLSPGTIPDQVLGRMRQWVPLRVRQIVDPLTPANAQRVARCSLSERFMWCPSRRAMARQLLDEILPTGPALLSTPAGRSVLIATYRSRMHRVARGTITR